MQSIIKNIFGRHLFLTNTGISFGLSGIGDLLEQKMESNQKQKTKFTINWTRTMHMSTSFGLTSGVMCHFWYNYLDKTLPGRGIKVVVQKIAWDQVCLSVCLSCLQINVNIRRYFSVLSVSLPALLLLVRWRTSPAPVLSVRLSS